MAQMFVAIGALFGFLGVAAGAFGAHALSEQLPPDRLAAFETGARYQLVHAVGLMAIGITLHLFPHRNIVLSGWAMCAGIVVFSGSLYALALSGVRILGAVTPIGGLALLAGWLLLAWGVLRAGGAH